MSRPEKRPGQSLTEESARELEKKIEFYDAVLSDVGIVAVRACSSFNPEFVQDIFVSQPTGNYYSDIDTQLAGEDLIDHWKTLDVSEVKQEQRRLVEALVQHETRISR